MILGKMKEGEEQKSMHITLTGNLGSGKSTISKLLSEQYGYDIFSTGTIIRRIASEHNISVLEMNKLMETDHKYDHMIDDTSARISRENPDKDILFDSRLAWNFVETSFKVFLSVSLEVAAKRVMEDVKRGAVESYATLEEAKKQLRARAEAEDSRYREIYGIEYFNYSNYNLILDSTDCSPEILAQILIEEAKEYATLPKEKRGTKLILSLNRPAEDFVKERAAGAVKKEILHGVEFEVITLSPGREATLA